MLTISGTIVALVSGVVGLLFLLDPNLKPSGKAPTQSVKLSQLRIEPATRERWLNLMGTPTKPYTQRALAQPGELLLVRAAVTGYEGKRLDLRSELFPRAGGKRLYESKALHITPPTGTVDATPPPLWVPLPHRPGKFYAVVQLGQQKENFFQSFDTLQTPPFSGLASRRS